MECKPNQWPDTPGAYCKHVISNVALGILVPLCPWKMKKMTDLLRRKPTIFLEEILSFGTKFIRHGVKIASLPQQAMSLLDTIRNGCISAPTKKVTLSRNLLPI
jgi:hypothetical protein